MSEWWQGFCIGWMGGGVFAFLAALGMIWVLSETERRRSWPR